MGQLEVICDSFNVPTTNSEFRLWLTSYSSEKVPTKKLSYRFIDSKILLVRRLSKSTGFSFQCPCFKTASKWPTSSRKICKQTCSEVIGRIPWAIMIFLKVVRAKNRYLRNYCTESRFSTPSHRNVDSSGPSDGTCHTGSMNPTITFPYNSSKYIAYVYEVQLEMST